MHKEADPHVAGVLQKVGRNIVLFATLEKTIRLLVEATQIYGTVDLKNPTEVTLHYPHPKKSTLGKLMVQLCQNLFGPIDAKQPGLLTPTTAYIFQRLTIEMTKHEQREWTRTVLGLIVERNALIHTGLAEVDFRSQQAVDELTLALDDQHRRLAAEVAHLQSLYRQVCQFRNETNAAIQSEAIQFEAVTPTCAT
jgi:hypothetical protein